MLCWSMSYQPRSRVLLTVSWSNGHIKYIPFSTKVYKAVKKTTTIVIFQLSLTAYRGDKRLKKNKTKNKTPFLPSNTWWLFLSSVCRPPYSLFSLFKVPLFKCSATSFSERLSAINNGVAIKNVFMCIYIKLRKFKIYINERLRAKSLNYLPVLQQLCTPNTMHGIYFIHILSAK